MKKYSLENLRKICHKREGIKRAVETSFTYKLSREISIRITQLIVNNTSIQANKITYLMFISGVIGCILWSFPIIPLELLGIFLYGFSYILDRVDGEVARFRKIFSIRGVYVDWIYHRVINPLFYVAMGIKTTIVFPETMALIIPISITIAFLLNFYKENNYAIENSINYCIKRGTKVSKIKYSKGISIFGKKPWQLAFWLRSERYLVIIGSILLISSLFTGYVIYQLYLIGALLFFGISLTLDIIDKTRQVN